MHLSEVITTAKALVDGMNRKRTNSGKDKKEEFKFSATWASDWLEKHGFTVKRHTQDASKKA